MNTMLMNAVLDEIISDVKNEDMTAISELLLSVPRENMVCYLPEELHAKFETPEIKPVSQMADVYTDPKFMREVARRLDGNTSGRTVMVCGRHTYSDATVFAVADHLKDKGYQISYDSNSYGVRQMVISW